MDELTPMEEAIQWREWAYDDARRKFDYRSFELNRDYRKTIEQIEKSFCERMTIINLPQILKTPWGVLFA